MFQADENVLWNRQVGPGYYRLGLSCDPGYERARPGQFVMLRLPAEELPFLRRPFSIHRLILTDGRVTGIEILYQVVGAGTHKLSKSGPGEKVDLLGPLGKGFAYAASYRQIAIVAGGIGVAPMLFLACYLKAKQVDPSCCKVFLGARSSQHLLCEEDFARLGMPIQVTTDDGSSGDQCLVTFPVETLMEHQGADMIYACGPPEMLKCIVGLAQKHQVACQISVEALMACGMGACLGCAVQPRGDGGGYWHACVDGPGFDAAILKI